MLPRAPYSVAEVVAYLYAAKIREEFSRLSVLRRRERDRAVQRWGKRVGLRWAVGQDGHARVSVDVKELEGGLKRGRSGVAEDTLSRLGILALWYA